MSSGAAIKENLHHVTLWCTLKYRLLASPASLLPPGELCLPVAYVCMSIFDYRRGLNANELERDVM